MAHKASNAETAGKAQPSRAIHRPRHPRPPLLDPDSFPESGFSLWCDIRPFVRFSREWVRQREAEGKFPRGKRIAQNMVVWPNAEIRRFLADPFSYRVPESVEA